MPLVSLQSKCRSRLSSFPQSIGLRLAARLGQCRGEVGKDHGEKQPNIVNIFRLVHTIKGTCGFLGLPRLEALAHAGETLMGKFRDGMPVTAEAVTLISPASTASRKFSPALKQPRPSRTAPIRI